MADFYHIFIDAPGLSPDSPILNRKLNNALDWIRYGDQCWLIYTTGNAAKWYERLGPLVKERGGNVFIVRVDVSQRQGWMPKSVWKWIRDAQTPSQ